MNHEAADLRLRRPDLTADERAFFRDADPLGFILFARNVEHARAARAADRRAALLRGARRRAGADRPGGRPGRAAAAAALAQGAAGAACSASSTPRDPERGLEATRLNSRLLAADVASIGADVDCLPVLDIAFPETHAVIGDRAYADQPEAVAALGRAAAEGLMAEGVHAGHQAHPRPRPRHRRLATTALPRVTRLARDAGAHRLPALQAPGRPALGDDRPPAVRGDRSRRPPSRYRHGA